MKKTIKKIILSIAIMLISVVGVWSTCLAAEGGYNGDEGDGDTVNGGATQFTAEERGIGFSSEHTGYRFYIIEQEYDEGELLPSGYNPVKRVVTDVVDIYMSTPDSVNYNIIKYPLELFLILCLFKLEMDVTNMIILKVMNHFGISKIKRKVGERQKSKTYDYLIKDDISKYIDEKNNDIKQYEEKQKDSLRYDLEYQKKTIWKFQLVCLIILFFIATFIPDWLFMGHQGDAINVITIFTLIMLYVDKRKEWRY